jgi:hypothetical protein
MKGIKESSGELRLHIQNSELNTPALLFSPFFSFLKFHLRIAG